MKNKQVAEPETVSLKEYFERILAERDKALSAALASAKEAVLMAEETNKHWRDNANEWRAAMGDKDARFMTVAEYLSFKERVDKELKTFSVFREERAGVPNAILSLEKDVRMLTTFKDSHDGHAGEEVALITKVGDIDKEVKSLTSFKDQLSGKASQSAVTLAQILGICGLILSIAGIIMRVMGL